MAPAAVPKKPSGQERIELISGPRVDVYVGPQKKHYSLPKNLLCYYSDYFKACFNGKFIEGQTQKLTLDEDKVEDFEFLVEYMLSGGSVRNDHVKITETGAAGLKKCLDFIEYTDKYGMGDASEAVYDALQKILPTTKACVNGYDVGAVIQPSDVETVFRVTTSGNPLRPLIAKTAFATAGLTGKTFSKQEREIHGFAKELLALMRPALSDMRSSGIYLTWADPFNASIKRSD